MSSRFSEGVQKLLTRNIFEFWYAIDQTIFQDEKENGMYILMTRRKTSEVQIDDIVSQPLRVRVRRNRLKTKHKSARECWCTSSSTAVQVV